MITPYKKEAIKSDFIEKKITHDYFQEKNILEGG